MLRHRGAFVVLAALLFASQASAEPPKPPAVAEPTVAEPTVAEPTVAEPTVTKPPTESSVESRGAPAAHEEALARLMLAWPIKPLAFSFAEAPAVVPLAWDGAPYTFRAEALWSESGELSLRTVTASEPAIELDCRVTCRPLIEQSATLEGRFKLGSPGKAVPEVHAFARARSAAQTGQSFSGARPNNVLQIGLGGLLDL